MKKVTASAPGKLMLFGEHSVVYGHPCLVTAVDQRLSVTVERNGENIFELDAPDLGLKSYSKHVSDLGKKQLPQAVRFIETLYKIFLEKYPQKESVHVITKSDFSANFGFGSSSASTVAFAKAISVLYGQKLDKRELFDLCYQVVIEVQGVGSGFDLAAAIWGGTLYYVPPAEKVENIKLPKLSIVVGYTGVKADTPTLVRMVQNLKVDHPKKVNQVFNDITRLVGVARHELTKQKWSQVGKLMTENHQLLKKLQVSSRELEKLTKASLQAGAYGAKLSGAGGGDCMIAVVNDKTRDKVATAIEKAGGQIMTVKTQAQGVNVVHSEK